jgi:hypothetical protein
MIEFLITIISLVFMGGCSSDIVKDLPNEYTYISETPMQKSIIFEGATSLKQQEENYIPCKVIKYKFNQNYIISKIKFHYDMNCVVGFKESKRLKEGKIYYYILDTVKNIRYGEFDTYEKFNVKLKTLKVGLEL